MRKDTIGRTPNLVNCITLSPDNTLGLKDGNNPSRDRVILLPITKYCFCMLLLLFVV